MLKQGLIIKIYELKRPLPKRKKKKVIVLMKDKFGGKIMRKFVGLRAKTYSYSSEEAQKKTKAHRSNSTWK